MKPIKPKALSKRLLADLTWAASDAERGRELSSRECRAILAALSHERSKAPPPRYGVGLRPHGGCEIREAAEVLCSLAKARGEFVPMTFSGVELMAHPETTPDEIVRAFYMARPGP